MLIRRPSWLSPSIVLAAIAALVLSCAGENGAPPRPSLPPRASPTVAAVAGAPAPLTGPLTIGASTFRPGDLGGALRWTVGRSASGITTVLRPEGSDAEVALQAVGQDETSAFAVDELLRRLAPIVLSRGVTLEPFDSYELYRSDGTPARFRPVDLVGDQDCIAAASYRLRDAEGVFAVVIPGCGGRGGITVDTYAPPGSPAQRDVGLLSSLVIPPAVGR